MKKLFALIGCYFLFTAFIAGGNESDVRVDFVNMAIDRFEGSHVLEDEIDFLRQMLADWMNAEYVEGKWIDITNAIYSISKSNDVKSIVTISTYPNDKATIKYQTVGQRDQGVSPTTAKELTKCKEEMYVGFYYIWSEREGEATSDKDEQRKIVAEREEVEIKERN